MAYSADSRIRSDVFGAKGSTPHVPISTNESAYGTISPRHRREQWRRTDTAAIGGVHGDEFEGPLVLQTSRARAAAGTGQRRVIIIPRSTCRRCSRDPLSPLTASISTAHSPDTQRHDHADDRALRSTTSCFRSPTS